MKITPLPSWAKGALWIGLCGLLGFALGGLVLDFDTAMEYALVWALVAVAYTAGVVALAVKLAPAAEAAPAPAVASVPVQSPRVAPPVAPRPAAPARHYPLRLEFDLPDVPEDFPPVTGHDEPLRVYLRVVHNERVAQGAAVRLSGQLRDGARFVAGEGVTGSDGSITLNVTPPGTGELLLEAEARLGDLLGAGMTSVSIVRYDEEIERLFGEFRAYAVSVLGPDSHADTARELAEKLRIGANAEVAKALLELARIYELVAYGERQADRALYVALMRALLVLERTELPGPTAAAARPLGV